MGKLKLTASQQGKIRPKLEETHDVRPYRHLLTVLESDQVRSMKAFPELVDVTYQSMYKQIVCFEQCKVACELSDVALQDT